MEFAKGRNERGQPLTSGAGRGAAPPAPHPDDVVRVVLGCVPLWTAGAGAVARQIMGTRLLGMLAATLVAVFIIPVLFVVVEGYVPRERRAPCRPPRLPSHTRRSTWMRYALFRANLLPTLLSGCMAGPNYNKPACPLLPRIEVDRLNGGFPRMWRRWRSEMVGGVSI